MLHFYEVQLILLATLCVLFLLYEKFASPRQSNDADNAKSGALLKSAEASAKLAKQYLIVYAIVMGADWLQGPYIYSLYREEYAFPEMWVAVLYVTGFMSAGLTAPLVGVWADQYGRRRLCLAFCITYAITCGCLLVRWLPLLLVGRVLGGISTSILYSAFESWLMSSSSSHMLSQSELSRILGLATLLNGFVATAAGVISNRLVSLTDTFTSPFIASASLLLLAWTVIRALWGENYGSGGGPSSDWDIFQLGRLSQAWKVVRNDAALLVIGLTQTCFEGSMYLFVFIWVPSLQEAATLNSSPPLNLGYIFSSFMVSMMLGSILYSAIVTRRLGSDSGTSGDSSPVLHAKLSSLVCAMSALTLVTSIVSESEKMRFWAFCVFEACVGMYYPVQGMLRGTFVSNEHRATLSSLFRVPLNIFVVISLLTGATSARRVVLGASSFMLSLSALMMGFVVIPSAEHLPLLGNSNLKPA